MSEAHAWARGTSISNNDIRDVQRRLAEYSLNAKVVRRNNETHLFVAGRSTGAGGARAALARCTLPAEAVARPGGEAVAGDCADTGAGTEAGAGAGAGAGADVGTGWTQCPGCELCVTASRPRAPRRDSSQRVSQRVALYPPLVLLPTGSAADAAAAQRTLEQHHGFTHVAVNAPIAAGDPVRRPKLVPLVGDFGVFTPTPRPSAADLRAAFWCTCVQNGIFQTWAPMYTMFSRGNITEKKRVLTQFAQQAPIAGSTVVDLYAGIGYFTLSYAKNGAGTIYCWELNWWSVEGLLRAARQNKIRARAVHAHEEYVPEPGDCIVVFVEDNQRALERAPRLDLANISHINMGLLPHCRDAFPVALDLAARSRRAPVVHIHENVRTVELEAWQDTMTETFGECLHVEKIKSYSPGVVHVCGDFSQRGSL